MRHHSLAARDAVRELVSSPIREVANAGMGHANVAAFWFGEPDQVTPDFIRRAAIASLESGETFYTENMGIAPLRESIARYVSNLHRKIKMENVAVTNSGMSALMIATQALVGPGDRVVIVTPVWPNLVEIPKILGAQSVTFPLSFGTNGWFLDLEKLLSELTPATTAVYINSPNNPTGWTIDGGTQALILEHCRKHGIWILADDAYERLYYGNANGLAPSFLSLAHEEDRLVSTNTFSKAWQMTGWRLGWIVSPRELAANIATLIEYNTSCAPAFVQRAGMAALESGESTVSDFNARLKHARDYLLQELQTVDGVEAIIPSGAMYAFFKIHGAQDSLAYCKKLIDSVGLGLAPGIAFGPEGEGFVRWCFAASDDRLRTGIEKLKKATRCL